MRRTTPQTPHRTGTVLRAVTTLAAATAAAGLLAGCGTHDDGGGTASPSRTPSAPSSATPPSTPASPPSAPATPPGPPSAPPSGTSRAGCVPRAQLTAADTGRTVCLTAGGQVRLTLDGDPERPWTPVRATGHVLEPINTGIVVLPGDALAAYRATAPGTSRLTSSRPLCASASRPGRIACQGIRSWTVTVRIVRP